jgi:hypothetical protein
VARRKSMRLGGGGRFAQIAEKAAREYGSEDIGRRVAAAAGMSRYGKRRMLSMARAGRKRHRR